MTATEFFQYWKGVGIGVLVGIGICYLSWKLPGHLEQVAARWQQAMERRPKVRAEIERIEGAFRLERYTPNRPERPYWGERVIDWIENTWAEFVRATAPRTPEQVARETYLRAIGA